LYDYSWFVGFGISFVAYFAMMQTSMKTALLAPETL